MLFMKNNAPVMICPMLEKTISLDIMCTTQVAKLELPNDLEQVQTSTAVVLQTSGLHCPLTEACCLNLVCHQPYQPH